MKVPIPQPKPRLIRFLMAIEAATDIFTVWMTWPVVILLGICVVDIIRLRAWHALLYIAAAALLWAFVACPAFSRRRRKPTAVAGHWEAVKDSNTEMWRVRWSTPDEHGLH